MENLEFIKNSALWAAYGDALGFLTELADEKGLAWRAGTNRVEKTIPWRRRIGGRFGIFVELPAGCYSDDTQLRLATCRSIRGDGKFDVEAFSKVELPVWLSYSLGAGRGTKSAAMALSRRDVTWTSNFFQGKESRYIDSGGNGAAMRIQPHVWASKDFSNPSTFLPDVIRNAICTHGHPRGILGAVFHALCLAYSLERRNVPGPNEWIEFVKQFHFLDDFVHSDKELSDFWLPAWERYSGHTFSDVINNTVEECLCDFKLIEQLLPMNNDSLGDQYTRILRDLGGMSQEHRGSGTKTAIFASLLAWLYGRNPITAVLISANLFGSDTDTITSMAGAIIGSITREIPPGDIRDIAYIEDEALRLSSIGQGKSTKSFTYPDLLKWNAPSTQSNFVGMVNGRLAVSGLGYAKAVGTPYFEKGKDGNIWEWLQLEFGQHILAKRRSQHFNIPITNLPLTHSDLKLSNVKDKSGQEIQKPLFDYVNEKKSNALASKKHISINEAIKQVIGSGFNPTIIGRLLLELSDRDNGIEHAIGFSAIVAKLRKSKTGKSD